jgi:hypothetical protein
MVSRGEARIKPACQHSGGLVLSPLYTAKREQSFRQSCNEPPESIEAREPPLQQFANV